MDNTYSYQASGVYFQPTGPDGKPVMGDNINQVTYTPPVEYTGGDVVQRIESAAQNVDWKKVGIGAAKFVGKLTLVCLGIKFASWLSEPWEIPPGYDD